MNENNSFFIGIKHGIPICLGYLSVSFAFGISAARLGLPAWEALVISLANVTSAGQLAGLPLIVSGAPLAEIALTQFVINIRYALMSLTVSQKLDGNVNLFDRFIISFVNTDEIFAVASSRTGDLGKKYMYGLILTPYLGWAAGTYIGAAAGGILPDFIVKALGIAIYGMFIAIIIPPAKKHKPVMGVVLVSAALSCVFAYTPYLKSLSSGFAMIISALAASFIFAAAFPVREENENIKTDSLA